MRRGHCSRRSRSRKNSRNSSHCRHTSRWISERAAPVALVAATAVAIGLTYTDHAPLIPLIAEEFRLSDVQSGLLSTALFATAVVTMLIGGGLADRYGAKRMV